MEDEHFVQAVAQTIDALTFAQTHIIDCDFRAHSKTTADSVASLQQEQRSRVENTFGAIGTSPEYLAAVLHAMYRGEAAAVTAAKDLGLEHTTLDTMSDHAARAFKKEMKQRIHEWEAAFRERYQQEASPADKVPMRPIYELYKCAKARVLRADQSSGGSVGIPGAVPPTPLTESRAARPVSAPPSTGSSSSLQTTTPVRYAAPHGSSSAQQDRTEPQEQRHSNPVVSRQNPQQPSTPPAQQLSGFTPTGAVRNAGAHHAQTYGQGAHEYAAVQPAVAAAPHMSNEDLANEKRRLKRILHQFESEFEARYGRKPTKDDRKDYAKEYNRYGELKSLINESAKAGEN